MFSFLLFFVFTLFLVGELCLAVRPGCSDDLPKSYWKAGCLLNCKGLKAKDKDVCWKKWNQVLTGTCKTNMARLNPWPLERKVKEYCSLTCNVCKPCVWGKWSSFGNCSAACGIGKKTRTMTSNVWWPSSGSTSSKCICPPGSTCSVANIPKSNKAKSMGAHILACKNKECPVTKVSDSVWTGVSRTSFPADQINTILAWVGGGIFALIIASIIAIWNLKRYKNGGCCGTQEEKHVECVHNEPDYSEFMPTYENLGNEGYPGISDRYTKEPTNTNQTSLNDNTLYVNVNEHGHQKAYDSKAYENDDHICKGIYIV